MAVVDDRHFDCQAFPFSTADLAIEFARDLAWTRALHAEDVEEANVDGWLYSAAYSPEGDCVWVLEHQLDDPEWEPMPGAAP